MKKVLLVLSLLISTQVFSQTRIDSLKESIDDHKMKLDGFDERIATIVSDVEKLTKIKISGYIQSQFDYYDQQSQNYLKTANSIVPTGITNSFYIRRARLKATYEATDGVKFVLQPDFATGNLALKDAYVVLQDKWFKTFSLFAGQFNRPNYEVEYSSSSREVLERSKVIKALYLGEREIGAKLEANPKQIPLKVQFAFINGNFTGTEAKDVDNAKDFMGRAVYSLKFQQQGLGIDLGASGYMGQVRTKDNKYILKSDLTLDSLSYAGQHISRSWFGAEMQIYWDFLGGLSLKGEFLTGRNASIGIAGTPNVTTKLDTSLVSYVNKTVMGTDGSLTKTAYSSSKVIMPGNNHLYEITTTVTKVTPNLIRNFSGYYIYLVKNIGKDNQLIARWDNYTPNNIPEDKVSSYSDLTFNTLTVAWNYFYDENIRVTLGYEMPMNKTNANSILFKKDVIDNTFSIRLQAKF